MPFNDIHFDVNSDWLPFEIDTYTGDKLPKKQNNKSKTQHFKTINYERLELQFKRNNRIW
jgi:hypothetical protein